LQVVKRFSTPKNYGHGIFSLEIFISILEYNTQLLDLIKQAFSEEFAQHTNFSELSEYITVYTSTAYVKNGKNTPWYFVVPFYIYGIIKSSFPSQLAGLCLPAEKQINLIYVRELD